MATTKRLLDAINSGETLIASLKERRAKLDESDDANAEKFAALTQLISSTEQHVITNKASLRYKKLSRQGRLD